MPGQVDSKKRTSSAKTVPEPALKKRKMDSSEEVSDEEQGSELKIDDALQTFTDLGIKQELTDACAELGWKKPTPIQKEAIPLALSGRDVIGLAETGSGKTGAFSLPMLQDLLERQQSLFGLVLAPTRELAFQISHAIQALGALINVRVAVLVGGMDMVPQAIALGKKPHIVVATPGRLLDHLENTKGFSLRQLKYLIFDEADRMLDDLDFSAVLDKILKVLPREGRRTYLFSATLSPKVDSLQRASLQNPVRVSVSSSTHQTVSTLVQSYLFIPHKHKDSYLIFLLNANVGKSAIVFTRTVNDCHRLSILLKTLGMSSIPLHGQLSQSARLAALAKFRDRSRSILCATDVAARGLDIPSVDLVLQYDLPNDSKTYVHRVGRTARAGRSGKAICLVTQYDLEIYLRIEKALGRKLEEEKVEKDQVMVLVERVGEAQRIAVMEMKNLHDNRGKGGILKGRKRAGKRDDMDEEQG
jgi:ATP-dependent RNA helicase DDX47/RRP3